MLKTFIETLKNVNYQYFKFMDTEIEFVIKLATRLPAARDWFIQNKQVWDWLINWTEMYKMPPVGHQQQNIRMYKKRMNPNYMGMQHNQRSDNLKN